MTSPDTEPLRALVRDLAGLRRGSATAGERRAAMLVSHSLRRQGARVWCERERVHPTYWWPLGVPAAASAAAALTNSRAAAVVGALATGLVVDDLWPGPRWLRRVLPHRDTVNVVAEIGPPDAARTVVVAAHHDAAHTGLVFRPWLVRPLITAYRTLCGGRPVMPPVFWAVPAGPVAVALGDLCRARRLRLAGAVLAAGTGAVLADIARSRVVPGANDNASGVASLVRLAAILAPDPPRRVRVLLLSTGAEESLGEGMRAWLRRHRDRLPTGSTWFVCLESVGSEHLGLLDAEGMLARHTYTDEPGQLLCSTAADLGVPMRTGLSIRVATDGQLPLLSGYPTATLISTDGGVVPRHYHQREDMPAGLRWDTITDAARLAAAVVARLDTVEGEAESS